MGSSKATAAAARAPTRISLRVTRPAARGPLQTVQEASAIKKPATAAAKKTETTKKIKFALKTALNNTTTTRKCVGCKAEQANYLYLALFPKFDTDYKEKCFGCRRVDAIGDFLKTHAKGANGASTLELSQQRDHLDAQRAACNKWVGTLANRGLDVDAAVIQDVMDRVTKHPALRSAATTTTRKATPAVPAASSPDAATSPASSVETLVAADTTIDSMTATIIAFARASAALEAVRDFPAGQFEKAAAAVFRRDFDHHTMAAMANMITESVHLALASKDMKGMEQRDLEAARTLASMKFEGA